MVTKKPPTSDPLEIQRDAEKLVRFLSIYCDAHHRHLVREPFRFTYGKVPARVEKGPDLCPGCTRLLRHALIKRVQCPLDPKPKCRHCPDHCYRPLFRDQMETVMRYAGPRSLFRRG